jgi:hypothetical protein
MRDARLQRMEDTVLDLGMARALTAARAVERARFAEVYLAALPPGPTPGTVWADLSLLSTDELLLLSGVDAAGWSRTALRELAMEGW